MSHEIYCNVILMIMNVNPWKTRPFEKPSVGTQRNEKEKITVDDSNRFDRMPKNFCAFWQPLIA